MTPTQGETTATPHPLEGDRHSIRELLRHYGLRTSLIRFKVIDALLVAARDGRSINVRGVHRYLGLFAGELSLVSVREVLRRLCDEGVIFFQADKSYRFTKEASAILRQYAGG
ncbi:fe2+ zn2+ uptake regulation protein [Pseudomonas sp. B21-056]|jgi:Fe2+ or Zn2+ uptake regulation protein|uniref:fe2+ zn2+ uptake regulation protein n=1 Tax=Pseudomonas sp. B21-056 TaxID=2895495 RepID=UPI00222EAEE2|nr:fe2+ zn2+ uptake regulation protein [Pseudomonas sp. B21-056]UZE26157.1 fe2+ zn2+ uptake regulation protein [Pseudomonas sp. B21-056]